MTLITWVADCSLISTLTVPSAVRRFVDTAVNVGGPGLRHLKTPSIRLLADFPEGHSRSGPLGSPSSPSPGFVEGLYGHVCTRTRYLGGRWGAGRDGGGGGSRGPEAPPGPCAHVRTWSWRI